MVNVDIPITFAFSSNVLFIYGDSRARQVSKLSRAQSIWDTQEPTTKKKTIRVLGLRLLRGMAAVVFRTRLFVVKINPSTTIVHI